MNLELLFWVFFFILIYTYIGYALILSVLFHFKKWLFPIKLNQFDKAFEPRGLFVCDCI